MKAGGKACRMSMYLRRSLTFLTDHQCCPCTRLLQSDAPVAEVPVDEIGKVKSMPSILTSCSDPVVLILSFDLLRVGRTGRFGTRGVSVSFVTALELGTLRGYLAEASGGEW